MAADRDDVDRATIADFGSQWTRYTKNDGYYGSVHLLGDIIEPLVAVEAVKGKRVAEIGSGSGRIINMLMDAGAAEAVALEPSEAFDVMVRNIGHWGERVRGVRGRGEDLPLDDFDYVFSIGVLHHVVDPAPIIRRALAALKPGGHMLVWVYGHEGNEAYLRFATPLRRLTKTLPDPLLVALSHLLMLPLDLYILLCHFLPLPMRDYMCGHLGKLDRLNRRITIFDQLNPAYAKYYPEAEARALLEDAGFIDVHLRHRHGYSWTVVGTKPG